MEKPIALVTGAGRGIGRGVALHLAANGFAVAGNARSYQPGNTAKGLYAVEQELAKAGADFLAVPGDIGDLEQHNAMIDKVYEHYGRIDLLVNNAGIAPAERCDLLETSAASYDHVLKVNARGPFFLTQNVAGRMIIQARREDIPAPAIVFITSISANTSSISRAEYCVSKAALSMISSLFAHRLAAEGINVYELRPGITRTDMTEPVKEKYDKLIAEGLVPQNRWGEPDDIGRAVLALARGYFSYSTGLIAEISGGMDIRRL